MAKLGGGEGPAGFGPEELAAETTLAVQARSITKWYADRLAVDGVDLLIPAGKVHGLLGQNGAGKTTLLRVLLGLVRADQGTVRLLGHLLDPAGRATPDQVAAVLGTPMFYPALTGRRTLQLLAGLDGRPAEGQLADALERVGLTSRADDRVGSYSLGMRARLGLAAALLRRPRLLLLDEPANGLDPSGRRDLRRLIQDLAQGGVAVLLSSHDLDEVAGLCDAVTVLQAGRVRFAGPLSELRARMPAAQLRTSDDGRAAELAGGLPALVVSEHPDGGLSLQGPQDLLDAYVLLLGRAGVAVRNLQPGGSSLTAAFLDLIGPVR